MSPDIAQALRATVRERRSFLVMAVPRLAGKSTVTAAMLASRPRSMPLRTIGIDGDEIDALLEESAGGYIEIPEISSGPHAPGYIWGAKVRRVFAGVGPSVALAAALHAPDPGEAFAIICRGCGVPDRDAAKVKLAVYLRSLGEWQRPTRRVVATVHEIDGVSEGRPRARLLFRWDEESDRFAS